MKILAVVLLALPMTLMAQKKVGINTTSPLHPFQINVDSAFTNFITDQQQTIMDGMMVLIPGSQMVAQGFTVGQSGKLARVQITLGVSNVDEMLVEVYSGAGPLGGWLATTTVFNVSGPGTYEIEFNQPWPNVTAGQQLNFLLFPVAGTTLNLSRSLGNTYPGGQAHLWNGSWSAQNYDLTFRTYVAQADTASVHALSVQQDGRVRIKNYVLPGSDGTAGQVMSTNGAGMLVWSSPGSFGSGEIIDDDGDTHVKVEAAPDEDIIRFQTAGSEKMNILANGNVGMGISGPLARLHVRHNSTTASSQLRLTETSVTDFARIKFDNENDPGIFWDVAALADSSATASKINFYYANPGFSGDKMTITGEGSVGIGTTTPGNRLRVNGSTTSSQHVFSAGTNYTGNIHIRAVEGFSHPATGFGIGGFFQGGFKGVESFGNGGSFSGTVTGVEGYATGLAGTRIGIYGWASGGATNWAARFGTGNVWIENNVRIDGNVGIGTGTPATALDVNGKVKIGNDGDAAQAGMIRWNAATNDFEGYDGSQWLSLTAKGLSGGWGTPVTEVNENEQRIASDGAAEDEFGREMAISGNYVIVGAPYHNTNGNADRGKAYIFFYNGTSWSQQAILTAPDGVAFDYFGQCVATDGNYAVVGSRADVSGNAAQGKVYVFVRNGTTWAFQTSLVASDGAAGDAFGKSVAIHSDFILVGASHCDYSGHSDRGKAYIFERTGTTWPQAAILTPPDGMSFDGFGSTVSLSGAYALVGAPNHDTNGQANRGKAYVFAWAGASWPHQATLIADDGSVTDFFGSAVSISGDYAVVGAEAHDAMGYTDRGRVYVYMRSGTSWTLSTKITAPDGHALDHFGASVSILGDQLLVGASQPNLGTPIGPGKAYLFTRAGSIWNYTAGLSAGDGLNDDQFGRGVAISANHSIVGAPEHDTASQNKRGKIYFFKKQ